MQVTAEHLRAAHDAAIDSLDPSQRDAVDRLMEAAMQASFTGPAIERRLHRMFQHEAAGLNAKLAGVAG